MRSVIIRLAHSRLSQATVSFAALGAIAMYFTSADTIIQPLNILSLAFSLGVIVAYSRAMIGGYLQPYPDRSHLLATGIVGAQVANLMRSASSLMYRSFHVDWIIHSDFVSAFILISSLAAACHLTAPEVMNNTVPTREWIKIGIITFFAALIFLILLQYGLDGN